MKRLGSLVLVGLIVAALVLGQPSSSTQAPIAGNPKVEIKGKIERIQIKLSQLKSHAG